MNLPKKQSGMKGIFAVLVAALLFTALTPCVNAQADKALQVKIITPGKVVEGKSYWILVYVKDAVTKRPVKANVKLSGLSDEATSVRAGLARFRYTAPQVESSTAMRQITATVTSTGYSYTQVTKDVLIKSRLEVEVIHDGIVSRSSELERYGTNTKTIRVKVTSDNSPIPNAKVYVAGSRLANKFNGRLAYTNDQGIATLTYTIPAVTVGKTYDLSFKATKYPYYLGRKAVKVRITP